MRDCAADSAQLAEPAAREIARTYGIRVPASTFVPAGASPAASLGDLQPPYVVKVVSPDLVHKSDAGGVRVGLADQAAVEQAVASMQQDLERAGIRVEGFLVDEFAPAEHEMLLGGRVDDAFGPLLMVGLGGTLVEVLDDVQVRVCPVRPADVIDMLESLRAARYLAGVRGRSGLDVDSFVEAALRVGGAEGLLVECEDLFSEVDLNPVRVSDGRAVAVDVRLITSEGTRR